MYALINLALVSFRCADSDGYAIEVYWEALDTPLDYALAKVPNDAAYAHPGGQADATMNVI